MNNYSWLQQKLHQIALSSQFMRETSFDIESSLFSTNQSDDNHVFVTGLARSGTTMILNALYQTNQFASLSYKDMPFVLSPNLWSKLSLNKKDIGLVERAHGDGIQISAESPEAFEEVFWMTYDESSKGIKENLIKYIGLINLRYEKKRYLSKNNQNIRRLALISSTFPNSKIVVPFRNPIQHAHSLLTQHHRFIDNSQKDIFISNYMKWIGHTEFGPNYIPVYSKNLNFNNDSQINHWIEQWVLTYRNCFEILKGNNNIYFICYETLCSSKEYWRAILNLLNVQHKFDFTFKESHKKVDYEMDRKITREALALYSELPKSI